MIQYSDIHGGYQWHEGWFKFLNGLYQLFRLGLWNKNISPPQINGQIHCGGQAKHMKKGKCSQHNFIAVEGGKPCANLLNLFAQIAMGKHNAF